MRGLLSIHRASSLEKHDEEENNPAIISAFVCAAGEEERAGESAAQCGGGGGGGFVAVFAGWNKLARTTTLLGTSRIRRTPRIVQRHFPRQ
jgi:galactokinase/mevalonate kinase-like predicted kinase